MCAAKVLVTCIQLQRNIEDYRRDLASAGLELILPRVVQQLGETEMLSLVPGVDGMIAGDDEITRNVLLAAHSLRVVSKWGVGTDNIDLTAAEQLGIRVTNTPSVFGDEVADVVIGYLILLARQLHRVDAAMRAGMWAKPEGVSLAGRTIGIVGLGDIGRAVSARAQVMGMRVIGVEPSEANAIAGTRAGIAIVDLPTLFREADVVSLNCPLTTDNRHMIDPAALQAMKPGAWIINTARGALIDEAALTASLDDGHLGGAALDVFEIEPLPAGSRLRERENVILGSHNSSNTGEAIRRASVVAIDNLLKGLREVSR